MNLLIRELLPILLIRECHKLKQARLETTVGLNVKKKSENCKNITENKEN